MREPFRENSLRINSSNNHFYCCKPSLIVTDYIKNNKVLNDPNNRVIFNGGIMSAGK